MNQSKLRKYSNTKLKHCSSYKKAFFDILLTKYTIFFVSNRPIQLWMCVWMCVSMRILGRGLLPFFNCNFTSQEP